MKLLIFACTLSCALAFPTVFSPSSIDDNFVRIQRSPLPEGVGEGGSDHVSGDSGRDEVVYGTGEGGRGDVYSSGESGRSLVVHKTEGGRGGDANLGKEGRAGYGVPCPEGQVPDAHGVCSEPDVTRDVFVYAAPAIPPVYGPPPPVPRPKVNYNVVFVRTPEQPEEPKPVVVPPPQQKTIVYVLTKNDQKYQQVIEVPEGPEDTPSVFYVNYNKGDNPTLLGDISLSDVLNNPGQQAQVVTGGGYASPPPYPPPPPPKGFY
ncbi:UNVERIFIED_CONTAM: hypothetical protein RMT77_016572 [Armadillidium vulgare]